MDVRAGIAGEEEWAAPFAPVESDPPLAADRVFARLFEPVSGVPDAALVVAHADGEATAYLVLPAHAPRLVRAAVETELLYGALPELVGARVWGEWREIPPFVPRSLDGTAAWIVMAACLR